MVWKLLAVAGVALAMLGCSSEDRPLEGTARESAVVVQLVRLVAQDAPVDPELPDALPLVFVVGYDGTLAIEVQASVVATLVDEIDVRFVDERAEAIDDSTEDRPVREGGLLAAIGPIPAERRAVDVEVERYVHAQDVERFVATLVWRDSNWAVTTTTPIPVVTS